MYLVYIYIYIYIYVLIFNFIKIITIDSHGLDMSKHF